MKYGYVHVRSRLQRDWLSGRQARPVCESSSLAQRTQRNNPIQSGDKISGRNMSEAANGQLTTHTGTT